MYNILLELPAEPQPNELPLTISDTLEPGRFEVTTRHGVGVGAAYAVSVGASLRAIIDGGQPTTVHRLEG